MHLSQETASQSYGNSVQTPVLPPICPCQSRAAWGTAFALAAADRLFFCGKSGFL